MKWYHFIMNMRFRNKMILSYIVMALIPFTLFILIGSSLFVNQAQETTTEHTSQMIGQVRSHIDVYIGTIDRLAAYISRDENMSKLVSLKNEQESAWNQTASVLEQKLIDIALTHQEIAGILIATANDQYISTGLSRISRDPFVNESWYQQALASPDEIQLISNSAGRNVVSRHEYSADDVFALAKAITDPDTGEIGGVILFDIKHDVITDSIKNIKIGEKGFVFIADAENNIVYTPINPIVYRVNPKWLIDPGKSVTKSINRETYQIRYEISDYTGWKTVGVFSLDEMMSGANRAMYLIFWCMVALIILSVMMSFYLASSVTMPIRKLRLLMKRAEEGDLTVRFNSLATDEVGELGRSFNNMIIKIDNLIDMVRIEQQSKRNAELKSLQEQIKPHFLYNTLDTISWMAREYDAKDIVRLVDALTNMFRVGLSHGRETITVREEISHVSNYLYIQRIRYKDKLAYEIDVEEVIYDKLLAKLILQPLVENSIYHGLKMKRNGGTIRIRGFMREDRLIFRVEDDGIGVEPKRLEKLQKNLLNKTPLQERESFGLFYVNDRIQLTYGTEYGITIQSVQGEGTVVEVSLPGDVIR